MPRRMPTAAQLLRDRSDSQPQLRGQAVEQAALADAGVAGEGNGLAPEEGGNLRHPLPRLSADLPGGKARPAVNIRKLRAGVKVAFVDADRHGDILVPCDGGDPVQQERVRHRVHVGGQEHEAVDIRDGRAHKAVAPGRQAFDHAGLPRDGDLRHVADQGVQCSLRKCPRALHSTARGVLTV